MMARFGRRRGSPEAPTDEEEWPDDDAQSPAIQSEASAAPAAPVDDLPPHRLRGTEITYGYGVGAVIAIAGVVMLVVTTGKGAPTHPQPIWAALGVVFGLATILSIRFSHRMLTALIAIAGGFFSGQARTPNSLAGIKMVALIAPVVYGVVVFRRQSKADRVLRARAPRHSPAERRAARAAPRTRGAGAKGRAAPGRPPASGRYTPPKAKRRGK